MALSSPASAEALKSPGSQLGLLEGQDQHTTLEFSDCQQDSPYFRNRIREYEAETDNISDAIKSLVKQQRAVVDACRTHSRSHRAFAEVLNGFNFARVSESATDNEIQISGALSTFGELLCSLEDQREIMCEEADLTLIKPLEEFRKNEVNAVKECKKRFDKQTERYYQHLEKTLTLSAKKKDQMLQEADVSLEAERLAMHNASLEYVEKLNELEEKKKFEFVERILGYIYSQVTFFHLAYESFHAMESYMQNLALRLQNTRFTFDDQKEKIAELMRKNRERAEKNDVNDAINASPDLHEGYLFMQDSKKGLLGYSWTKHFCRYVKATRQFMILTFVQGKPYPPESYDVTDCHVFNPDSNDRRFCFEIVSKDRTMIVQAPGQQALDIWVPSRDTKARPVSVMGAPSGSSKFVQQCINFIETHGLDQEGLYRLPGVQSKVQKVVQLQKDNKPFSVEESSAEIKTVCSALKQFFRELPEPLMTFGMHQALVKAAKIENRDDRLQQIYVLVHDLPRENFGLLKTLVRHLNKVSQQAEVNKMQASNLGVCFGPSLMRSEEESMAAIMDIKFQNSIVEWLVENYEWFFENEDAAAKQAEETPAASEPAPTPAASTPTATASAKPFEKASVVVASNKPAAASTVEPAAETSAPSAPSATAALAAVKPKPNLSQKPPSSKPPAPVLVPRPAGLPTMPPAAARLIPRSGDSAAGAAAAGSGQLSTGVGALTARFSTMPPPAASAAAAAAAPTAGNRPTALKAPNKAVPTPGSSSSSPKAVANKSTGSPAPAPAAAASGPKALSNKWPPGGASAPAASSASGANGGRRAVALYDCVGEDEGEISFNEGQTLIDVQPSNEDGWLEGTNESTNRRGLFPSNYVSFLSDERPAPPKRFSRTK
ncbi:rho GTPase activating protein 10 [Capsaspora owczarzaki ATCC 30864]|uniref:rho GTPase activating protein 10 n=1 Tax=Capsaspora owczarzaki (strain ATCC 30864) TaxID=595528 RepID=UPI00035246FD|nr:rho GTPase activating protein 10 [Capsaspora owczarzaki ATCC 30864]|eukprot:XP_004365562.2 rho GTPase activating protein 10 [Capsaspora owczarzaki ATCC 30864]